LNELTKLFQSVQPGLTLYGVLLTFAVLAFSVGKYFWEFERTLITECVDRLKTLLDGHRRRSIEPILTRQIGAAISAAYDQAVLGLIGDIYGRKSMATEGQVTSEAVSDEELKALVSEDALRHRLDQLKKSDTSVEAFLSSQSGDRLYEELEHAYREISDFWLKYRRARECCWRTSYSFLSVFILLMIGLLQLLESWPAGLVATWIFLCLLAILYGLSSFLQLEYFRRRILRAWEELQIHGKV